MQQPFDLDRWLEQHELDRPQELERALNDVPAEQRALALLSWVHVSDLGDHRIQVTLR